METNRNLLNVCIIIVPVITPTYNIYSGLIIEG